MWLITGLTALRLACAAGRVAAVDAERGSLHHYAGMPDPETARPLDYDEARIGHDAEASDLIRLIEGAAAGGYEVLVIDGISHLWRHLRAGVDNASRAADGWGKLNAAICSHAPSMQWRLELDRIARAAG